MSDRETVALLGVGTMGAGMARNLAAAGFGLRVWNRNPAKAQALQDCGAVAADTPATAVDGAGIVITMLWDADNVAAVIDRAATALAPGTLWIQTSTAITQAFATSLSREPWPAGPTQSVREPIASNTGAQRSRASTGPEARTTSVPCSAGARVPSTGAST